MLKSALVALVLLPGTLVAQSLPPYQSVNPVLSSRSALYFQPVTPPHDGWRTAIVADYSNAIETSKAPGDGREFMLDAELMRVDFWLGRDLSAKWFLAADVPLQGAHDGFLDSFLNWYHDLIGLKVPARNRRPLDTYGWTVELPDRTLDIPRQGLFLGDLRVVAGRRLGPAQLTASLALPTATNSVDEWSRGTVGMALGAAARLLATDRVIIEAGLTAGYTPTHGDLARYQRTWFVGGSGAFRWRFAGQQALFATLFTQSASWQDTGFHSMDDGEVTLDFGGLLRPGRGWPTIQAGMTEDLYPRGPSVDAGFKLGLHWQ